MKNNDLFAVPLSQPIRKGDELTARCNYGHEHRVRVVAAEPGDILTATVLDTCEGERS